MRKRSIVCFSSLFLFYMGYGQESASVKTAAFNQNQSATANSNQPAGSSKFRNLFSGMFKKDTMGIEAKEPASEPFAFGDFSWLNGNSRKTSPPAFDSKYFTGDATFDFNYTHSYNSPIDNTVVGSTALARDNELQLSFMGIGGDIHVNNVRGRIMMPFGTRSTVVPRNDGSSYKGQYDLQTIYRYLSEAYAGYHWDTWHGINLDAGIFMSYIGLFSYNNFENWGYQPSYTSDNTPWFFNGLRLQTFPSDKLKVEFWLINGWQSYGMFNNSPGVGASIYYRPKETVDYVFNNYYGRDDEGAPGRYRFHSDNSYQLRYVNRKHGFITKAAFSLTADFGFEDGDGVTPFGKGSVKDLTTYKPAQNFISGMLYNRLWFGEKQKFAWNVGGGYMHNPGQYLVLAPTGYADTLFQAQTGVGSTFDAWDYSTTFDYMPSQNMTLKIEFVHRQVEKLGASPFAAPGTVPLKGYFAGHGGVTSPTGYANTGGYTYASNGASIAPPLSSWGGWQPDMVKSESRIVLALLVRF
jgi:Putative beta-barrel porin-2, OmpL-like. bbp2